MQQIYGTHSSSSSSSVSTGLCNSSGKNDPTGCLLRFLRRFFCSRGNPLEENGPHRPMEAAPAPIQVNGVVAALMGLEPMPAGGAVPRSRKVCEPEMDTHHAYFELENEEFLVLRFDREGSELEVGGGESKARRRREKRGSGKGLSRSEMAAGIGGSASRRNRRRVHGVRVRVKDPGDYSEEPTTSEGESSPENGSPVSVLDCPEFLALPGAHTAAGGESRAEDSGHCSKPSVDTGSSGAGECEAEGGRKEKWSGRWGEICSAAAADSGGMRWEMESLNDIVAELELRTLDELLEEVVCL